MSSKNQSGFITIAIAIIIAITLLGLVSWELYSNYFSKPNTKSNNQTSSQTNNPAQQTNPTSQPTQPTQPVDPNAGYFVIKEWGVRFKPVSGLDELQYVLWSNGYNAVFTTQQLKTLDTRCNATESSGFSGIGGLSRFSTTSTQPITNASLLTTINSYNYYYAGTQTPCPDPSNKTALTLFGTENTELYTSLKSLEAAK